MNRTGSADQTGRRPSRSRTRASRKYSIMSCDSRSWLGTPVVEVLIFAAHKPVDQSGCPRENNSCAASIRYVEASRAIGVSVMPQLHVKVADTAPDEPALTAYDPEHPATDATVFDAEAN